jgi:hypothetical protein
MNECYVLGLGESLSDYTPQEKDICFGVNDIWRECKTEYVVCLEKPKIQRSITRDRLDIIKSCYPSVFYTNETGWEKYHNKRVQRISLNRNFKISHDTICCSNNSPFVACAIASRHGFDSIVLYGVDFNNHWQLTGKKITDKIINDYSRLNEVLLQKNITLYIGSKKSILSNILPLWKR